MRWRGGDFLRIAIVAAILLVMLLVTSIISSMIVAILLVMPLMTSIISNMIVVLCDTVATMLQPSSPSILWSP